MKKIILLTLCVILVIPVYFNILSITLRTRKDFPYYEKQYKDLISRNLSSFKIHINYNLGIFIVKSNDDLHKYFLKSGNIYIGQTKTKTRDVVLFNNFIVVDVYSLYWYYKFKKYYETNIIPYIDKN